MWDLGKLVFMSEKYSGQSQTEWGASWSKKGRKSRGSCLSAYHPPRYSFSIWSFFVLVLI